jgi:transcriptional regulator GlxA family with amidase domain
MSSEQKTFTIGVLAYPNVQQAAVYGIIDLITVANSFKSDGDADLKSVEVCRIEMNELRKRRQYSAIIIPPSLTARLSDEEMAPIVAWVKQQHQRGTLLCSVCGGAFILAKTGLLDQRPATTHWAFADEFRQRYPGVLLDTGKLLIDDGDVITAGGLTAWIDLGLLLVERFLTPAIMLATARFFLVDPGRREQRFYSSFSPSFAHGDQAILRAQHWIQTHYQDPVTVVQMAEVSRLEKRTFIRRFKKATNCNPSEYVQQLRIAKAKENLELTRHNVDKIAHDVGYEDLSAFRRIFYKITALTPREYRQRFSIY